MRDTLKELLAWAILFAAVITLCSGVVVVITELVK